MALERVIVHLGQSVGGAHHDLVQLRMPQAADYTLWSGGGITCEAQLVGVPRHHASSPSGRGSSAIQLSYHGTAEPQERGGAEPGPGNQPAQRGPIHALFTVLLRVVYPREAHLNELSEGDLNVFIYSGQSTRCVDLKPLQTLFYQNLGVQTGWFSSSSHRLA